MSEPISPIEQAEAFIAESNRGAARVYLEQICREDPENLRLHLDAALVLFNEELLDIVLLEILDRCLGMRPDISDLWFMYAHVCLSMANVNIGDNRGIDAAVKALTLNPDNVQAYHTLIRTYLVRGKFWEAYMASRLLLEKTGDNPKSAKTFVEFAEFMLDPEHHPYVGFVVDGEKINCMIDTSTPAILACAMDNRCGHLHELDTLRFAREFVGQADNILEIGTVSGNHTAFFLRFLVPIRYLGIDDNPIHADVTRKAAFQNKSAGVLCKVDVMNMRPSSSDGTISIQGHDVPCRSLDQTVGGTWDFIRIDMDDGLMNALKGAEAILCNGAPRLMIRIDERDGTEALEWLESKGYSHVKSISDEGRCNHFLHKAGA